MEVRFFKKSERELLLNSISRLWRKNHVYVRKPEVLEHLVLNTPYRAEFAGEENYSFVGMWNDENKVIGIYGSIPQRFNVFGKQELSGTSTTWFVDKSSGKRISGSEMRDFCYNRGIKAAVYFGLSNDAFKINKIIYDFQMIEDFPRWIGIKNLDEVLKSLLPENTPKSILPVLNPITENDFYAVEIDDLNQEKWDEFYFNRFAPITIGTQRDYRFLKWRYMESPVLKYKFVAIRDSDKNYLGLAVIRREEILNGRYALGRILEFISLNAEASIALANAVVKIYPDVLAWDFYCLSDITSYGLEMVGFRKIPVWMDHVMMPTRFQPIDYDHMKINGSIYLDDDLLEKLRNVANVPWYITRGDSDQDRAN